VCDVYSRGTAAAPSTRVIGIENIFGGYTRTPARVHTAAPRVQGDYGQYEERRKEG